MKSQNESSTENFLATNAYHVFNVTLKVTFPKRNFSQRKHENFENFSRIVMSFVIYFTPTKPVNEYVKYSKLILAEQKKTQAKPKLTEIIKRPKGQRLSQMRFNICQGKFFRHH